MAAASGLSDLTLCVELPGQAEQEVYVQHGLTLGRDSANTVQINHPDVERIHVRVLQEASGVYAMECLGSAVLRADDGKDVSRTPLREGTRFTIGPAKIVCRRRRSQPAAVIGDDPWQVRCPRCHASLAGEPQDLQACPTCGNGVFFCRTEEPGGGKNGFEGWLPRDVGPYRVDHLAGVGGMGIVLRGMNRETGVLAAIKLLRNDPRGDPSWRVRFLREADVLKKVKHRNVVRLQDCGEDEHLVWLAMDWVDGEPLSNVLSRSALAGQHTPPGQVRDWMEQIVEGLSHLHALGIIHRDLKPQNILLADDGLVKIADVGLAKACQGVAPATQVTQTGMVAGTPGYMSPEQAQGRDLTAASDVYSLGVIWLEMMTGQRPLTQQQDTSVLDETGCPAEWADCIQRCLSLDPGGRPTLHEVRLRLLEPFLSSGAPSQACGVNGADIPALTLAADQPDGTTGGATPMPAPSVQTVALGRRRSPKAAFVLNFLFPGAGYIYAGRMWGLAILIPWGILGGLMIAAALQGLFPASDISFGDLVEFLSAIIVLAWHACRMVRGMSIHAVAAHRPKSPRAAFALNFLFWGAGYLYAGRMWGVAILAGIPLALCLLGPEYAYTLRLEGMIAFLVGGVVLGWHAHRMAKNLSVQTVGLRRRRASEVAFVLNFLFPGAGYVYAERMWGLAILIPWVILEAVVGLLDLAPASLSCRLIHCAIQILIDVVLGWHAYRLVMSRPEVSLSAMPPRVLARLTARTAFWVTVLGSLGLAYGATWAWAAFNTAGTVAPAAEQKLTALELGYKYEKGLGVDKNDSVAALWYRKAAEAGDADGMFRLGLMYWTGRGVSRDDAEGTRWIRKAADAGSSNGMFGLGAALSEGRGVSEDAKEGARWYEEAAKKGNAVGMRFTGIAYLSGNGVPQSDLVAAAWFRDAADAGDTDGMCGFAALLATGRGVSQNDLDAARWYLKAAQGGNPTAMLPLGEMYENGNGVPRDLNEAAKWYREAAKAGNPDAEERLRRVGSAGK